MLDYINVNSTNNQINRKCFQILIICFFGITSILTGENRVVTKNTDDGSAGTLRFEIENANSGDVIEFNMNYPATISLNTVIEIKESILINGPGTENLIISGNNSVQIFNVWGIVKVVKVNINNITIEKGNALNGGAIFNFDHLILSNCVIRESSATNGGGIANQGVLNIENCNIHSNTATNGGAITNNGTNLLAINSYFSGNEATNGGGLVNVDESIDTLINCVITGNKADNTGGIDNSGNILLINCTIAGNSSINTGGVRNDEGTVTIINTIIGKNSANSINDYEGNLNGEYSLVQDSEGIQTLTTNSQVITGEDPLFIEVMENTPTIEGNFMLQNSSQAVNGGTPDTTGLGLPVLDISGAPRVVGDRIDIGAFENNSVVDIGNILSLPISFALDQNYPNPFNPSTTIKYTMAKLGEVNLKVYDLSGSEVKVLVEKIQPKGTYEIEFDGTGLTSGIYFYKLQTSEFTETKKMILLK